MSRFSEKAKLIAAAVFGGVVVISGAATAATGSLPIVHGHSHQPATHTPDGDDNDDQGTDVEDSTDTADTADVDTDSADPNNDHGSLVSTTAHNAPKGHKGPAVCTVASDGKCKAGQDHGQNNATTHGKAHQNTNSATHRQNDATTHGNAGPNANSLLHRQNGLTTHGKAGQHGNANKP